MRFSAQEDELASHLSMDISSIIEDIKNNNMRIKTGTYGSEGVFVSWILWESDSKTELEM